MLYLHLMALTSIQRNFYHVRLPVAHNVYHYVFIGGAGEGYQTHEAA